MNSSMCVLGAVVCVLDQVLDGVHMVVMFFAGFMAVCVGLRHWYVGLRMAFWPTEDHIAWRFAGSVLAGLGLLLIWLGGWFVQRI